MALDMDFPSIKYTLVSIANHNAIRVVYEAGKWRLRAETSYEKSWGNQSARPFETRTARARNVGGRISYWVVLCTYWRKLKLGSRTFSTIEARGAKLRPKRGFSVSNLGETPVKCRKRRNKTWHHQSFYVDCTARHVSWRRLCFLILFPTYPLDSGQLLQSTDCFLPHRVGMFLPLIQLCPYVMP